MAQLASQYGREYFTQQARSGGKTTDLWLEIGKNGYLGINIPEEYGGGGGGIGDVAAVCEELAAQGCPLLMMVVSPAICGTVISRFGTEEQKQKWLPGICDGTATMAFAITEPDAGSNSHNITTTGRRDGDGWVLNGRKIYISGVDEADARARGGAHRGREDRQAQALPVRGADRRRGLRVHSRSRWRSSAPEQQFQVFIDDVRLPADALVGDEDAGLVQLFAGLNPERIMARVVLHRPGALRPRQGGRLRQGARGLRGPDRHAPGHRAPAGAVEDRDRAGPADDPEGGRALRRGRRHGRRRGREHGEVRRRARPPATPPTAPYSPTAATGSPRSTASPACWSPPALGRIAPVSREMILNFVGMHSLGLPKSY